MGNNYAKKTCPRCGEELFADMQVCYGCLYDFTRSDNGPSEIAEAIDEPEGLGGADAHGSSVPRRFPPANPNMSHRRLNVSWHVFGPLPYI